MKEVEHSETQRQTQQLTLDHQNCSREFLENYFAVSDHVGIIIYDLNLLKYIDEEIVLRKFVGSKLPDETVRIVESFIKMTNSHAKSLEKGLR